MAEWSIASVLKTEVLKGTGGSNPSLLKWVGASVGAPISFVSSYFKEKGKEPMRSPLQKKSMV